MAATRQRGTGSKPAKPLSTQPRPTNDAYTGILAISLLALIVGCVFLYLDYSGYPSAKPAKVTAPPPKAPAEQPSTGGATGAGGGMGVGAGGGMVGGGGAMMGMMGGMAGAGGAAGAQMGNP